MIRDRESQIKKIEKKIEDQKKKMEQLAQQQKDMEHSAQTETMDRRKELEKMRQHFTRLVQQYQQSKDTLDMKKQQQQQGGSNAVAPGLHVYNEIMKAVSDAESTDSSYVLRMQAQLCKAMHSMGMMETQLQLTKGHTEAYQKNMKDDVTWMVEEKSQVELKLMNDLVLADNDRREVETKRNELSEAFTTEKDELMEKLERHLRKEQEDGEENGEEDEGDDEEEKEELKEILSQGREEIERLEQENKQEEKKLEELKRKVAEARGQDLVDDIVTSIAEEFKERKEENEDEDD